MDISTVENNSMSHWYIELSVINDFNMAIMMSYKVGTALVLVSIGIEIFMVIDH
jgi:hypothetical protein